MSAVPTFDPESKCPACGHDAVKTRYEGPIEQDPCWYDRTYKPVGKWPKTPYLHRTCERCGNEWPEAPLGLTVLAQIEGTKP